MHQRLADYIRREINISDAELALMMPYFHVQHCKKHEILLREGELCRRFYFVNKGCVRIFFILDEGQEATRYLAFENQFASALQSLISEEVSMEYIQVLEDSELLYISRNDFKYLLSLVPGWERFYRKYLEKAYVVNTNRLMSFITMDAEQRYKALLAEHNQATERLPGRIIASYLNISQETLSRIKTRLSEGV